MTASNMTAIERKRGGRGKERGRGRGRERESGNEGKKEKEVEEPLSGGEGPLQGRK